MTLPTTRQTMDIAIQLTPDEIAVIVMTVLPVLSVLGLLVRRFLCCCCCGKRTMDIESRGSCGNGTAAPLKVGSGITEDYVRSMAKAAAEAAVADHNRQITMIGKRLDETNAKLDQLMRFSNVAPSAMAVMQAESTSADGVETSTLPKVGGGKASASTPKARSSYAANPHQGGSFRPSQGTIGGPTGSQSARGRKGEARV